MNVSNLYIAQVKEKCGIDNKIYCRLYLMEIFLCKNLLTIVKRRISKGSFGYRECCNRGSCLHGNRIFITFFGEPIVSL